MTESGDKFGDVLKSFGTTRVVAVIAVRLSRVRIPSVFIVKEVNYSDGLVD